LHKFSLRYGKDSLSQDIEAKNYAQFCIYCTVNAVQKLADLEQAV